MFRKVSAVEVRQVLRAWLDATGIGWWRARVGVDARPRDAKHLLPRGFDLAREESLLLAACHSLRKLHRHIGVTGLAALPAH